MAVYSFPSVLHSRDGHETSMAETETRRLQVSRRDRDVEMHVVFNAVQVNVSPGSRECRPCCISEMTGYRFLGSHDNYPTRRLIMAH